ncbi:MAG: L-histidine N(alpha)-methyltransferase [Bacteroidia bacterium]|nr:L-histidine N(alpha)-methyltransferase [Bacteroidia bacterium]
MKTTLNVSPEMVRDIRQGLLASPKRISSQYFYDAQGSRLFQDIMRLEAYYPTRCEYDALTLHHESLAAAFTRDGSPFSLTDLGAGDGYKTRILVEALLSRQAAVTYQPIDISEDALTGLTQAFERDYPTLPVAPVASEYVAGLRTIGASGSRKVVLFLGSNIGNFTLPDAAVFLRQLRDALAPGDQLLIGFDLKKDPGIILRAYDDPEGVTRAFNFNLLTRLNRELEANFDLDQFIHYPTYDPLTGETRSYLVSTARQDVRLSALDLTVSFEAWEAIWVELSQKFDPQMIQTLAREAGFIHTGLYYDSRGWFADALWSVR